MFTGIIEEVGVVESITARSLAVCTRLEGIRTGDSIAVNGICLTVTSLEPGGQGKTTIFFDYSPETGERTSLDDAHHGDRVNLERALQVGGRLGGHIVTGHVEATATLLGSVTRGDFTMLTFSLPGSIARYVTDKGSITVDGISLTVVTVAAGAFTVSVIPHTMESTVLKYRTIGDRVNLEPDILAKYVENALAARRSQLTEKFLKENGF